MSEMKDPSIKIKLFGTTIPLPESQNPAQSREKFDTVPMLESVDEKDVSREERHEEVEVSVAGVKEEPTRQNSSSGVKVGKDENHATIEVDKIAVNPEHEEERIETDAASGEEKVLKKTDKILPCPRCNSMDTKFCYYNNYNVNQPRHFCKNCQRYWTAGGTMRNVPVGAGRRKNKHSASYYRHIVMSPDGIPTVHVETRDLASHEVLPNGLSAPTEPLKGNGTILNFGPDVPVCDSMETVLNLGDKKTKIKPGSVVCGESRDEPSCGSSMTTSTCLENELPENAGQMNQGTKPVCSNGFPPTHHLQCYPGPPWSYPWSPGWNNAAAMAAGRCSSELVYEPENGNPSLVQWSSPPMAAAHAFCAPSIPFPFVPASYWGCIPGWAGGSRNVQWPGSNDSISPSSTCNTDCSGNGLPTLGKHSRDANLLGEERTEKCLWVPKTLRTDDPDEAVKSSIWTTLGINLDPNEPTMQGGIFKAFQPRMEGKGHTLDAKQVLQANPAALSRSQMFQEST